MRNRILLLLVAVVCMVSVIWRMSATEELHPPSSGQVIASPDRYTTLGSASSPSGRLEAAPRSDASPSPPGVADEGRFVEWHVSDVQGAPIAGAIVKREGAQSEVATDVRGNASYPVASVSGRASYVISSPGYVETRAELNDATLSYDVRLRRSCRVRVELVDSEGRPLQGIPCAVTRQTADSGALSRVPPERSDDNGYVDFAGMAEGVWRVEAGDSSWFPVVYEGPVTSNGQLSLNGDAEIKIRFVGLSVVLAHIAGDEAIVHYFRLPIAPGLASDGREARVALAKAQFQADHPGLLSDVWVAPPGIKTVKLIAYYRRSGWKVQDIRVQRLVHDVVPQVVEVDPGPHELTGDLAVLWKGEDRMPLSARLLNSKVGAIAIALESEHNVVPLGDYEVVPTDMLARHFLRFAGEGKVSLSSVGASQIVEPSLAAPLKHVDCLFLWSPSPEGSGDPYVGVVDVYDGDLRVFQAFVDGAVACKFWLPVDRVLRWVGGVQGSDGGRQLVTATCQPQDGVKMVVELRPD
jgi:hypothetical protein